MTDDRTFQRRRLASLAAVLALVLGVGSLVGDDADVVDVSTEVAAGADVAAASLGSPSGVRGLLPETTTTRDEATGTTSTTTEAATDPGPSSTTSSTLAPTTTTTTGGAEATGSDAEPEPTVRTLATEDAAPEPTPTTAAPARTAPPTTAPAPTTTQAPAPAQGTGLAYDDPRSTQVWYDLAQCESGGRWSIDSGNGYYGGLQFSLATWESVGGSGYPHEHPAATQIEHGRTLQARQGWGAWPSCSEKLGLR